MAPQGFIQDYLPIMVFLGIFSILTLIVFMVSFFFSRGKSKVSDILPKFDSKYYIAAVLFSIFLFVILLLFVWAFNLVTIGIYGFASILAFLSILGIGFVYMWLKGVLEWE